MGIRKLYSIFDTDLIQRIIEENKEDSMTLNATWDKKERRVLLIFSMENWKKKEEENEWSDEWIKGEPMNVRGARRLMTEMVAELLELYSKEQEVSSTVPCAQMENEEITNKIELIKDRVNEQITVEAVREKNRRELGQPPRRNNGKWMNTAGFMDGLRKMDAESSITTVFEMVGTNAEIKYRGDSYQLDEARDADQLDHVIEIDEDTTTLIRTEDDKKITWYNGTSQLAFQIAQVVKEPQMWDAPRHVGGVIRGENAIDALRRIETFKKKFTEGIESQYVDGTMFLERTGKFMEAPGEREKPWIRTNDRAHEGEEGDDE